MIESDYSLGLTTFYCDFSLCSEEFTYEGANEQVEFQKAVEEAKEQGWVIKNIDGEWVHFHEQRCYQDYLDTKGL